MLSGTAMSSAMSEETTVPKINGSAPNCSCTGSHSTESRKLKPNFCAPAREPCQSSQPTSTTSTTSEQRHREREPAKSASPQRDGGGMPMRATGRRRHRQRMRRRGMLGKLASVGQPRRSSYRRVRFAVESWLDI